MKAYHLIFVLFIGIIFSFSPPAKGYKYNNDAYKFSITFPNEFEIDETTASDVTTLKITSSYLNASYMAAATIHSMPLTEIEALEDASLDAFINALNGKIITEKTYSIKGASGRWAQISIQEDDLKIQYIVIFKNNTQYQFVVLAERLNWNQNRTDDFFNTLKLK